MQRRQSGANDPPLQAACVNGTLTVLSNATPSSPRYRAAWQMRHAWEWLSTDSKRSGTAEQNHHNVQWMCEPSSSGTIFRPRRSSEWTRAFLHPAALLRLPDGAVHLAGLPREKRKEVKTMNTLVIVLIAAVCLFGAYALYGRWLANKWGIDPPPRPRLLSMRMAGTMFPPTVGRCSPPVQLHCRCRPCHRCHPGCRFRLAARSAVGPAGRHLLRCRHRLRRSVRFRQE